MSVSLPVAQVGNEQAFSADEVVELAVRFLAGNCDGAARRDDVGFNRLHAKLGHTLAEIPLNKWTERQFWAARKMLETYKNTQLAFLWPMMPPLPPEPPKDPYRVARDSEYAAYKRRENPNWQPPKPFRRLALYESRGAQHVAIHCNYDPQLNEVIKRLPQRRFVDESDKPGGGKFWVVPINLDTIEPITDFAVEHGFDIPFTVEITMTEALETFTRRMTLSHAADGDFDIDLPPGLELYPFQKVGVQFAVEARNALVADEMGLGKTVQALAYLNKTQQFPAVVVVPASLKPNWRREAKKWLPGKSVAVLDGKIVAPLRWANGSPAFDVVIVNYDVLGKWKNNLIDYLGGQIVLDEREHQRPHDGGEGTLILDECHRVKNPSAQRTKNIESIVLACQRTSRVFLSGTPVVNRPNEFWTLASLLGYGKQLGGYKAYHERYCGPYVLPRDLEELNTRARMFMVRRLKRQVLTELPEKQYSVVPLEIDNRAAYDKAEADVAAYFARKKTEAESFVEETSEALMAALQMGLFGDEAQRFVESRVNEAKRRAYGQHYSVAANNEQLLRWEALKQLAVAGKMSSVYDWLDDFLESGKPIIVFGTHTDTIKAIARRYDAPYIIGALGQDERDANVQRFLNDPDCKMIVGNMQAMGEGLTLHRAHTDNPCSDVAFVEFGWNPAAHSQAEDRIHRIGQRWPVNVWQLVGEGTIDEEIIDLIEEKRVVVDATTEGGGRNTQEEFFSDLRERLNARLSGAKRA